MPVVVWWGVSALLAGGGIKLAGDGVESSSNAARDLFLASAIAGGVYLIAKSQGILK